VITGPAGDFVGTGAVAATGDSGNNANAITMGPNTLTEPAMFISPRIGFYQQSPRDYTVQASFRRYVLVNKDGTDSQIQDGPIELSVVFQLDRKCFCLSS
jgi:hypothetical protein